MHGETWRLAIEKDGHRHVVWFRGVRAVEAEKG